jgi:AcrR family transcriptional regulator
VAGKVGPGRPRDRTIDRTITQTTLALLAEDGYRGLTTDAIAERAGVSKASIYRRWSSKQDVVVAAVTSLTQDLTAPDTGSLEGDLTVIVEELVPLHADPATARLIAALLDHLIHSDELAEAVRASTVRERRRVARVVLERGIERGEARADADLEVAIDLLAAPFYFRALITGAPIDSAFARDLVQVVLAWLRPQQPPRRDRS